jgi:hypothetical protein
MVKYIEKRLKKDSIINLTDTGRHNNLRVVRDLQDDGTYKLRQINWDGSLIPEENPQDPDAIGAAEGNDDYDNNNKSSLPIFITYEDKGSGYEQPYQPQDIESGFEESLENRGATVHDSTTYYPASGITTRKRSMTHEEIAEEKGYVIR